MTQASLSTALLHAASTPRPSACPGLLRIVAARDGGICRIKLPGGELSAAQARVIADASARHAAGVIELTNRANLQVRGVREGHEAALIAALVDAGLGPRGVLRAGADGVDVVSVTDADHTSNVASAAHADHTPNAATLSIANAAGATSAIAASNAASNAASTAATASAADDVRNVMISPAAGLDPFALIDTTPLCAELLTLLQSEARFAALSPKFALLLDGGERLARVDHPHDVWLAAASGDGGVRFVFGLAGCPGRNASGDASEDTNVPARAATESFERPAAPTTNAATSTRDSPARACALTRPAHRSDHVPLATVSPAQVPALVHALLHTFLDLASPDTTRMRELLATHSADALLQHAQRYLDFPLSRDASLTHWRRHLAADPTLRLGAHAQHDADTWHIGIQPPLGRLDAATLHGLAALAQRHGNGTLRATPWQSVLLPDIPTHGVPAVLAELNALGLVCDPAPPIAHLIACAGSSGCAKSHADTKADALQLAALLSANVDTPAHVHLSGCARSCAAAHCAPYTLLAVAPGTYDLYRRNDDNDDDSHDGRPGFGECVAHRKTIAQAADLLAHLTRSHPDA